MQIHHFTIATTLRDFVCSLCVYVKINHTLQLSSWRSVAQKNDPRCSHQRRILSDMHYGVKISESMLCQCIKSGLPYHIVYIYHRATWLTDTGLYKRDGGGGGGGGGGGLGGDGWVVVVGGGWVGGGGGVVGVVVVVGGWVGVVVGWWWGGCGVVGGGGGWWGWWLLWWPNVGDTIRFSVFVTANLTAIPFGTFLQLSID